MSNQRSSDLNKDQGGRIVQMAGENLPSTQPEGNPIGGDSERSDGKRQLGADAQSGHLILNADDWGRGKDTTDRIFDCIAAGVVSSTSAMVFMEDSERAAGIAREHSVDAGLHLNFTTAFSAPGTPRRLMDSLGEVAAYLLRRRLNQVVFHPGLMHSFEYVVEAQLDQFRRIYGKDPDRIDGHHHMHLCANVQFQGLLPSGIIVRRNFTFRHAEKSLLNRMYRRAIDKKLARRHRLVDGLYSLPPLQPRSRLQQIFREARNLVVEVETHPINADEFQFLTGGEIFHWTGDVPIARSFDVTGAAVNGNGATA